MVDHQGGRRSIRIVTSNVQNLSHCCKVFTSQGASGVFKLPTRVGPDATA